ncbi:MAG: hypothetical protein ABEN55_23630, partial [Bradymonadaceae bacterium]
LALFQRRFTAAERPYVWAGLLAHILAAFAQVVIIRHYYGQGDMLLYHVQGRQLGDWLESDCLAHAPQLFGLLIQQAETFRVPGIIVHGAGGSTGSMFAVSGFSALGLGGSLYAICMLWSLFAFTGQVAIYLGFRDVFRGQFQRRLLVAAFLIPTVVFWSGGLVKEAFALGGLGFLFLGVQRLIYRAFRLRHLVVAAVGAACVALFKPYILFPFFVASGAWYYWYRSLQTRGSVGAMAEPLYVAVGLVVAVGGVLVFGELFPRYAPSNLMNVLVEKQHNALQTPGGSTYRVDVPENPSLIGQLRLLPIGLTTALLRPFIVEAHNAVALINALETTAILGTIVWVLTGRGPAGTYRTIVASPTAVFCAIFVLLLATAVGLSSLNLGTISRYRIPMMPFYVGLLFLLIPSSNSSG